MEKTCCATGHRKIPEDKLDYVKQELEREIQTALEDGYRKFITGFSEGVDTLFARCVNERRAEYPDIFLEVALPYRLYKNEKKLLLQCDGVKVVCELYQRDCHAKRRRYMVQSASRVIAVYDGRADGGTLYIMNYARTMERELRVIQI
jgi:uncharacterized phage-like protein YoqJ